MIREMINNIHRPDRQAVFIFCASINYGKHTFHHTLCCFSGTTRTPFLVYYATFLVNFLVSKQQTMAPVVQNKQCRVEYFLTFYGHRCNVIHRLINACIGIKIGSKLYANAFTP